MHFTHTMSHKLCAFTQWTAAIIDLGGRIYRTHPEEGGDQKFTSAQVCARSLSRREWHQLCQLQLVVFTVPSLPTFCYYFTDTSRSLPHSPLPRLSRETTKDVKNPFLASNFAILTRRGSRPQLS